MSSEQEMIEYINDYINAFNPFKKIISKISDHSDFKQLKKANIQLIYDLYKNHKLNKTNKLNKLNKLTKYYLSLWFLKNKYYIIALRYFLNKNNVLLCLVLKYIIHKKTSNAYNKYIKIVETQREEIYSNYGDSLTRTGLFLMDFFIFMKNKKNEYKMLEYELPLADNFNLIMLSEYRNINDDDVSKYFKKCLVSSNRNIVNNGYCSYAFYLMTKKRYDEMLEIIKESIEKKFFDVYSVLGRYYEIIICNKDMTEECLTIAIEKGENKYKWYLSRFYTRMRRNGNIQSEKSKILNDKIVNMLEDIIDGNASHVTLACRDLGLYYKNLNEDLTIKYLQKGADNGSVSCAYSLFCFYSDNENINAALEIYNMYLKNTIFTSKSNYMLWNHYNNLNDFKNAAYYGSMINKMGFYGPIKNNWLQIVSGTIKYYKDTNNIHCLFRCWSNFDMVDELSGFEKNIFLKINQQYQLFNKLKKDYVSIKCELFEHKILQSAVDI